MRRRCKLQGCKRQLTNPDKIYCSYMNMKKVKMVYFPREMWAGSLRNNAREAGRIVVKNEKEYRNFIKMYNGKMNLFTSVYDYKHFTANRGLEYSIILDRIFLDFDAHGDEESMPLLYQDVLRMHQWLLERDYKHNISFSGRGFSHICIW